MTITPMDSGAGTETYRFTLGEFDCVALNDGDVTYRASSFFAHAPQEHVEAALRRRAIDPDKIPSPYTCLAINAGGRWILLDTGAGSLAKTTGHLRQRLQGVGIDPAAVETVIVTHAHPDHLGGNVDAEGQPAYPNARYVISRDEWHFWIDQADPEQNRFAAMARPQLLPIHRQIDVVDSDAEVVRGISLVAAPGHTAGQVAVLVSSGNEQLLYISDVVLHELHLLEPDWYPVYDLDREQAGNTKRRLFGQAAADRTLVHAFHFPFPGLGYVVQEGKGWQWQPVAAAG